MAYMLLSLLKLAYLSHVSPFSSYKQNILEKFNEMTVLIVGYLGCSIIYASNNPEMISTVGLLMLYVILIKIIFNLMLVTKGLIKDVNLKLRKARYKRVMKSFEKRNKLTDHQ